MNDSYNKRWGSADVMNMIVIPDAAQAAQQGFFGHDYDRCLLVVARGPTLISGSDVVVAVRNVRMGKWRRKEFDAQMSKASSAALGERIRGGEWLRFLQNSVCGSFRSVQQ